LIVTRSLFFVMGVYNWIKGYDFILKARNGIPKFCTYIESIWIADLCSHVCS
jgi:hypothetical protein